MCTYYDVVEAHSCVEPIGFVLNKDLVGSWQRPPGRNILLVNCVVLLLINLLSVSTENSLDKTLHTLTKQSSNENEWASYKTYHILPRSTACKVQSSQGFFRGNLKEILMGDRATWSHHKGRALCPRYICTQQNIHNLMHDHHPLAALLALNATATSQHHFQAKLLLLMHAWQLQMSTRATTPSTDMSLKERQLGLMASSVDPERFHCTCSEGLCWAGSVSCEGILDE